MKSAIIAVLFLTPVFAQAAKPLMADHQGELTRTSSISVQEGTLSELVAKIESKATMRGSDHYRITHINTDNKGYATATLYKHADM